MKEPKLIHFLKLLPKKERKQFRNYLASPFCNPRPGLVNLYEVLIRYYINGSSPFSLEKLHAKAYPDRTHNEKSLKANMSQLLSSYFDYLAYARFREDKPAQKRMVLEKLNALGEQQYFPSLHSKAVQSLEKEGITAADFHYEMTLLEEELNVFRTRVPKRDSQALMHTAIQHLGHSFLLRLMRYKIRVLNHQITYQPSLEFDLMDIGMQYIAQNSDQLPPIMRLYQNLIYSLSHPNDLKAYRKATALLSRSALSLARIEAEELYTSALNFVVRQTNQGQLEFLEEIFALYQDMLQHEIIVQKGKLSPWHFKNIVNAALRLEKFAWTQDFIQHWQDLIFPDYAHNAFHYNQAILYFHQNQFEQAERHFNLVLNDFKDIHYGLDARGHLLQVYFELGNMIGLESLAHASRMFIQRNQEISKERKRMYLRFINHLNQLINIPPKNHNRLGKLYQKIEHNTAKGMGTTWLKTKIAEMLNAPELNPKNQLTQASSAIPKD